MNRALFILLMIGGVVLADARLLRAGDPDGRAHSAPGWLGVRLDPPGPALDAQLSLEGHGLLISDLCVGSPAEQAGLQRYDILRRFGGRDVPASPGLFGARVRQTGPGEAVEYVVLRSGKEHKVHITLGRMPHRDHWKWRFNDSPDAIYKDEMVVSGMIARRAPNGEIIVEELAESDIPQQFRKMLPQMEQRTIEVLASDGQPHVRCQAIKGQTTLMIECGVNGVTVRRRKENDHNVQEQVYADARALQQGDQEAFIMLQAPDTRQVLAHFPDPDAVRYWTAMGSGSGRSQGRVPRMVVRDPRKCAEWQEALRIWEQFGGSTTGLLERSFQRIEQRIATTEQMLQRLEAQRGPASYSFSTGCSGQIKVTKRLGDAEQIIVFESLDSLRLDEPELFERYALLQASE